VDKYHVDTDSLRRRLEDVSSKARATRHQLVRSDRRASHWKEQHDKLRLEFSIKRTAVESEIDRAASLNSEGNPMGIASAASGDAALAVPRPQSSNGYSALGPSASMNVSKGNAALHPKATYKPSLKTEYDAISQMLGISTGFDGLMSLQASAVASDALHGGKHERRHAVDAESSSSASADTVASATTSLSHARSVSPVSDFVDRELSGLRRRASKNGANSGPRADAERRMADESAEHRRKKKTIEVLRKTIDSALGVTTLINALKKDPDGGLAIGHVAAKAPTPKSSPDLRRVHRLLFSDSGDDDESSGDGHIASVGMLIRCAAEHFFAV
jgi:hypothetical protein